MEPSENVVVEREKRPVLVQTLHGGIEGSLDISSMLRTLDDLNRIAHKFLKVEDPVFNGAWPFEGGTMGVNTSSILFVVELENFNPRDERRVEARRFSRTALRLTVGDFEIQGFLHVPGRGDPLTRLNQDSRPFLALTSVSVVGPDTEFAAPFLAVNRAHIMAAQEICADEELPEAPLEVEAAPAGG